MGATGSLVNNLYGRMRGCPTPEVGMGATELMFTDRHAGTIIEAGPRRLVFQRDKATRVDNNGMSDAQRYEYQPDPAGRTAVFTLRKNGAWVREGERWQCGTRLLVGLREEHYDFSF